MFCLDVLLLNLVCCVVLHWMVGLLFLTVLFIVFVGLDFAFAGFVLLCNSVVCLDLRCSDLRLLVVFFDLVCSGYVGRVDCCFGLFGLFCFE